MALVPMIIIIGGLEIAGEQDGESKAMPDCIEIQLIKVKALVDFVNWLFIPYDSRHLFSLFYQFQFYLL
jgi:hypothetical protein